MQNIGDNPVGYILFIIGIFMLLKVFEVILSGGTDRIRDKYDDSKGVAISIFLLIFAVVFFLGATPISEFLGVSKESTLFIAFLTFIIAIVLFKFNSKS